MSHALRREAIDGTEWLMQVTNGRCLAPGERRLWVDLTHSTRVGRRAAAARKGDTKLSSRAQWFAMLGGEENSPQTRHRLIRAGSDNGGFLRVWKD